MRGWRDAKHLTLLCTRYNTVVSHQFSGWYNPPALLYRRRTAGFKVVCYRQGRVETLHLTFHFSSTIGKIKARPVI